MRLIHLLLAASSWAATVTVCASGCDQSNLQTAINAAARGDTLVLTAGETFEGRFTLPRKTGDGVVTLRSSRLSELPPIGSRVGSAHSSLMPKLQPGNTTDPALTTNESEVAVSSADAGTDTITFGSAHGWSNGDPIAFWAFNGVSAVVIPVTENQIYYVRDAGATTVKLALTPGGSAVDIASGTISATYFRASLALAVSGWRFQGIEFRKKTGQTTEYNLVEVGTGVAANRAGIPYDIHFDRVYVHGVDGENGPRICMFVQSGAFSLTDSTVEHCNKEGEEGKALSGFQAQGPLIIRNNYLAAGSINVIFGGDFARIEGLVNGDRGGIRFTGNHVTRLLSTKYQIGTGGAGDPGGACSDGALYLNTTSGVLWLCASSAWGAAPMPATGEYFRRTDVDQNCGAGACWQATAGGIFATSSIFRGQNYYTKNLFEMKSVKDLHASGNVFENNWNNADQSGLAVWVCSLVEQGDASGWAKCADIDFSRNIIRQSTNGLRIARQNVAHVTQRNSRISVTNNLGYKISNTDYPSINSNSSNLTYFAGYCDECLFDHNTFSTGSNTAGGAGIQYDTLSMDRWRFSNSINYAGGNGLYYDGGVACTTFLPSPSGHVNTILIAPSTNTLSSACNTNVKEVSTGTTMFTSSTNFRIQTTSPYSAACASGCDFTGTDGKDLGADIDQVEAATGGAVSGLPWLGGSIRADVGSTRAVVRYTAPSSSACTLKLYTNIARTTIHGDTDTGGEQSDDRTGNVTAGTSRQFVLGTNAALTASMQYWAVVTCGTFVGYVEFRTVAAGSGFTAHIQFPSAIAGEYSSLADMSSPTAISSSALHAVPVPAGAVRYHRATGGAVYAHIAP